MVVWPYGKKEFEGGVDTTLYSGGMSIEYTTFGSLEDISLGHDKIGVLILKTLFSLII